MNLTSKRITIMGLGLHGGGVASARYCARQGARVTVTDLQTEARLAASMQQLADLPIRYVLGSHDEQDFRDADIVIKNPAVPRSNRYLGLARHIETDISLFLQACTGPIIAVTGSKGKSTTASAIHYLLKGEYPGARLGGNITTSPLGFLDDLDREDPVVLELSSFQLGDLTITGSWRDGWRLAPMISVITNIMRDHQDYYHGMESYVQDKEIIFQHQDSDAFSVLPADDTYCERFAAGTPARVFRFSGTDKAADYLGACMGDDGRGFLQLTAKREPVVPITTAYTGPRINLVTAALAARLYGIPAQRIRERVAGFSGIPHRMELIGRKDGISFINDTAATIPTAALATVQGLDRAVVLIAGGADKELELDPFLEIHQRVSHVILLDGSAGTRIAELFRAREREFSGPYASLQQAFDAAAACAGEICRDSKQQAVVLLSPGAASFNMFANEFDRGDQFRALAEKWLSSPLRRR